MLARQPKVQFQFSVVYDEHLDFVWSMLRRLGVQEPSLEDAVQDVFVVVHRQLAVFKGESTLKTWVGGIAVKVAHEHRRRLRNTERMESIDDHHSLPSGAQTPHLVTEAAEAWRALEQLLDTLDEEQRTVFVLIQLEELSAPEVAAMVNAPLNTVYSRLRLARAKLQAGMAAQKGEVA